MKKNSKIAESIITQGILPLFYHEDGEVSLNVVKALYQAGIRVIEYTNRGAGALGNFKLLKHCQEAEMKDLMLGIGTIRSEQEARAYIDAGAEFLVSPLVNEEIGSLASQKDIPWIPGAMTPTEINMALEFDPSLIKIFPANVVGTSFFSAIRDIFPAHFFMPTGGVSLTAENLTSWFRAGAAAVGVGGSLIDKDILKQKMYDQLILNTRAALQLTKNIKLGIKTDE